MNVHFWASRIHPAAKHLSAVQLQPIDLLPSENNRVVLDESELDGEEEDTRACFPCPFCYIEIELSLLCNHLQDEHCFDLNNAVCPLCAADLRKDVIGHFIGHHATSIKWRRFEKFVSSRKLTGKKMIGKRRGTKLESLPDPTNSPFICNVPSADSHIIVQAKSAEPCLLTEGNKEDDEKGRLRAAFVRQLAASTIFSNLAETW